MYLEHFGLKRHPFRLAPEDDFVYMSPQHARAFVYMDSTLWSADSFVVVTGEVGAGKTTLLKKLINSLQSDVALVHIPFTQLAGGDLFQLAAYQAGLGDPGPSKISSLLSFRQFLESRDKAGIPVILAVDEAQNLTHENLEDIRMLAGLESQNGPMMRVILLGQPELNDVIQSSPQLTQRVKLFFHLTGLSKSETEEYITHRLNVAGSKHTDLFDNALIAEIHRLSGGIPRVINKLCDGLMLCAFADERRLLDIDDLRELKLNLTPGSRSNSTRPEHTNGNGKLNGSSLPEPVLSGQKGAVSDLARIADALERIDAKLGAILAAAPALKMRGYNHSHNVDEDLLDQVRNG